MADYVDPKIAAAQIVSRSREAAARIQAETRELAIQENSAANQLKAALAAKLAHMDSEGALQLLKQEQDFLPRELQIRNHYETLTHDLHLEEIEETLLMTALAQALETVTIERARNSNITHATSERMKEVTHSTDEQIRIELFRFYLDECRNNATRPSGAEFEEWMAQVLASGQIVP